VHELAIADSVVRIACAHAAGRKVAKVELKVGHLRQVVPSALEFAFGLVAEGTELEGAELVIEAVPAAGRCRDCGAEGPFPRLPLACGACGSYALEIVSGEELLVDALELEEEAVIANGGIGYGD
jgi:hydrogenase nickel incorporation protein HypA/HybF